MSRPFPQHIIFDAGDSLEYLHKERFIKDELWREWCWYDWLKKEFLPVYRQVEKDHVKNLIVDN